jgi:hypothetical protein
MMKKILLGLAAVGMVAGGVAAMSAFEAHIINVTAKIENALSVTPEEIAFGTVFPQESLEKDLTIALSQSFLDEPRVDDVEYTIHQKPKPIKPDDPVHGWQYCLDEGISIGEYCLAEGMTYSACLLYAETQDYFDYCYPVLCPYLSKHPDGVPDNDQGVDAPDLYNWVAYGRLAKSEDDYRDLWTIDLVVPCFEGMCAQDYDEGKFGPPLPPELESAEFGCDLWIEVIGISESYQ